MKEAETARLETEPRTERKGRRRRPTARRTGSLRRAEASRNGRVVERFLKDNAAGLTFLGITLGVFVSRKFLILPVAVAMMLAQEKLVEAGLDRVRQAVRS
jgi:hypothetical protein